MDAVMATSRCRRFRFFDLEGHQALGVAALKEEGGPIVVHGSVVY